MSFFSSIGKLFGLGGGSAKPKRDRGYEYDQAKQSWNNYAQWTGELSTRFESDMANSRVRMDASGGTLGQADLVGEQITSDYEAELGLLRAGSTAQHLTEFYEFEMQDQGNAGGGQTQDEYFTELFGEVGPNAMTEDQAKIGRASYISHAAGGVADGMTVSRGWMDEDNLSAQHTRGTGF